MDGSLNLLGLETVRLIYFRNKMAGKNFPAGHRKGCKFMQIKSSSAYHTDQPLYFSTFPPQW